jgi:hypothetical protein
MTGRGDMEPSEDEFYDDDVPWASPEIQTAYEAALGRFMLAFNQLDHLLTEVIKAVLGQAGRVDLIKPCTGRGDFWLKLLTADLLKLSIHGGGISNVPIDLMREIATHRNKVAHGHFNQNPFSGDYDIITKNVRAIYSVEDLNLQSAKAEEAVTALRYAEAFYEFGRHPLPSLEGDAP